MNSGESQFGKSPHDPLPQVSEAVVQAFAAHTPEFEALFASLKATNPHIARFIMTRTAQLAPRKIQDKERLARLALELYGLMTAQNEADELNTILNLSVISEPSTDITTDEAVVATEEGPSASGGDVSDLPPAA